MKSRRRESTPLSQLRVGTSYVLDDEGNLYHHRVNKERQLVDEIGLCIQLEYNQDTDRFYLKSDASQSISMGPIKEIKLLKGRGNQGGTHGITFESGKTLNIYTSKVSTKIKQTSTKSAIQSHNSEVVPSQNENNNTILDANPNHSTQQVEVQNFIRANFPFLQFNGYFQQQSLTQSIENSQTPKENNENPGNNNNYKKNLPPF